MGEGGKGRDGGSRRLLRRECLGRLLGGRLRRRRRTLLIELGTDYRRAGRHVRRRMLGWHKALPVEQTPRRREVIDRFTDLRIYGLTPLPPRPLLRRPGDAHPRIKFVPVSLSL